MIPAYLLALEAQYLEYSRERRRRYRRRLAVVVAVAFPLVVAAAGIIARLYPGLP